MGFERAWSYPGHSSVESGGGAFKTGRVTGVLIQYSKLKWNVSLFLGVIHIQLHYSRVTHKWTQSLNKTKNAEKDKHEAAFRDTDIQLYGVNRAGYDLSVRSSAFTRIIRYADDDVASYQDDILITSAAWNEHLTNVVIKSAQPTTSCRAVG